MRRALLIFALLAAAAPASASAAPPASVKLLKCSVDEHEAAFYARMRQVEGSERMALRVTLLERTGVEGYRRVKVPGLRRWRWSKPGVGAFGYRQVVKNLPEHATHRARVDFRWYDAEGAVIERATRRSRACRQFEELPNLVAEIVRLGRPDKGVRRYEARVSNTGEAPVTGARVRLTVDGDVVETRTIAILAAGDARTIVFRGPACRRAVRVEVDPDKAITESSEDDNGHELSCA